MGESREHGQGATPRSARRRLLGRRGPLTESQRIAAVAHDAHVPVEEVLRDVADFRLALETDMIIAAAAVDAESPELLSEVVDGERLELATFHDRLLTRLADAAADDELAQRRARRPRRSGLATGIAAAAAAAAAIFGAGQAMISPASTLVSDSQAMKDADRSYRDFSTALHSDSASAVHEAADELHDSLEALITEHAGDPEVAQRAAQLLQAEMALLQINDPDGASQVLARAHRLARLLKRTAPRQVLATVAPVLDAAMSPKPTKAAKPSPTASPTSTKPTASPSPTPKPTSSPAPDDDKDGNPLDTP